MTVKEGLQAALAALGENGEKWSKGAPIKLAGASAYGGMVPEGFLCAMTACGEISHIHGNFTPTKVELFKAMRSALEAQLPEKFVNSYGGGVVSFNDAPDTAFADVKALFERAIEATA